MRKTTKLEEDRVSVTKYLDYADRVVFDFAVKGETYSENDYEMSLFEDQAHALLAILSELCE